jgi:hypothetical protein
LAGSAEKRPGLLIACGALAREIMAVLDAGGLNGLDVTCLPAHLHIRPQLIAEAVRAKVRLGKQSHENVFVLYADCGTGGDLDAVCAEEGVTRIPGAHCYEFFAGAETFAAMSDAEPAAFYLTDFLVRHFDRLVYAGLGLDRYPELLDDYFGNYRRVVYLAQTKNPDLEAQAKAAAVRLGLDYEYHFTGYGGLAAFTTHANQTAKQAANQRVST